MLILIDWKTWLKAIKRSDKSSKNENVKKIIIIVHWFYIHSIAFYINIIISFSGHGGSSYSSGGFDSYSSGHGGGGGGGGGYGGGHSGGFSGYHKKK